MTETDNLQESERKGRILAAVVCLGVAAALLRHDMTRRTEPPLHGALPWLGFLVGVVLLWTAMKPRAARILLACLCLGAAGALFGHDPLGASLNPMYGALPWFVLLLGLVLLWRAIPLRTNSALSIGGGLVVLGVVPLFPLWLILHGFWLVVIGFAFPVLVELLTSISGRRSPALPSVQLDRSSSRVSVANVGDTSGRCSDQEVPRPKRRPHPAWIGIWFLALFAAEYLVLKFHHDAWRPISARGKWILDYGCMIAIGVAYLAMMRRMFCDPVYRGGRAVFCLAGGLLCLQNLSLGLWKLEEARQEFIHDVDFSRPEIARYHGEKADIVVYSDSFHSSVFGGHMVDVMVEHHRLRWQTRALRFSGYASAATFEREGDRMKVVLVTAAGQPRVLYVDWN